MKFLALIAAAAALKIQKWNNVPSAAQVLATCDANGDGVIDTNEFDNCFTANAPSGLTQAQKDFIENALLNNGKIPVKAFMAVARAQGDSKAEAAARFRAVDTDNDPSAVSVTELRAYLSTQNLTSAQLQSI